MQSIPPTTADTQTQAQKRRGSRARKLLGAKAKSYRLKKLNFLPWCQVFTTAVLQYTSVSLNTTCCMAAI